jgi:hypothetical protein
MAPVHLDSGAQCSVLEVLGHALICSLGTALSPGAPFFSLGGSDSGR